jgi:hypothetical protein
MGAGLHHHVRPYLSGRLNVQSRSSLEILSTDRVATIQSHPTYAVAVLGRCFTSVEDCMARILAIWWFWLPAQWPKASRPVQCETLRL